jgi:hypothetical protein
MGFVIKTAVYAAPTIVPLMGLFYAVSTFIK